jgi:hypothetical protein
MRKGFLIVLAVVLVAALAAPAMAGMDAPSGFIRVKGYMSNFKSGATAPPLVLPADAPTNAYVEERFRAKFSFGEENVKAVWFVETDFNFGDSAGSAIPANTTGGAGRNSGGALGGDRINLETKNIYIWFKLPNTPLDFTVGLQNQTDRFAGVLYGAADMAGIFMTGKMEPASFKIGWAKFYENSFSKTDDLTLYVAEVQFAPTKELKIGATFNFLQDDTQKYASATNLPFPTLAGDTNKKQVYTLGVDGAFNAGPATISGFGFYQFGTVKPTLSNLDSDVDISGFAVDLRADMNLGPGKFFIEGIYISGDSNDNTNKYKSIVTLNDTAASPGGPSFYARTDMMILLPNADDINTNTALIGAAADPGSSLASSSFACITSLGNCGRGITHVGTGFSMPLGKQLTGKVGAGYLMATKKLDNADSTRKGKSMGTELNANVNYNIMKGLDFGLYGAYAWLGDFYQFNTPGAKDPDDLYDVHFRLNYAF